MEMIEHELEETLQAPVVSQRWMAYGEYRDSGVEWLGEIPAHWHTKLLKYVVKINSEALPEITDPDYLLQYIDISNVDANGVVLNVQELSFKKAPSRARRIVKHDDIIISTVRTYLRAIGYIENPDPNVIVSTGFAVLRPDSTTDAKFLWRLIQSNEFVSTVVSYSEGVSYPAITPNKLAGLIVWLPSLPEQRAIATFLDNETTKLDALIAKKEQLIALLQEKRAALISQTVTRGLNLDVPMKDSGVEWLGMVPEHWNIAALKRVAKIRYGLGQPPEEILDGTPLLRATNVKKGKILNEGMMFVNPLDIPSGREAVLSKGEIIVVRSGAYTGDSAIIPLEYNESIIGYDLVLTILNADSSYIAWQLLSEEIYKLQFGFYRLRAAQPHLNAEEVGGIIVTLPPLNEQQAIVVYLDQQTTKIDALITGIREGIEKVKEYRAALISAAVTGKIDVRGELALDDSVEGAAD